MFFTTALLYHVKYCGLVLTHDKQNIGMVTVFTFFGIDSKSGFEQKGYGFGFRLSKWFQQRQKTDIEEKAIWKKLIFGSNPKQF